MQQTLQKLTSAAMETFGFSRIDDTTLNDYMQRIKGYNEALNSLENACNELLNLGDETTQSLSHNLKDMNQILENSNNDIDIWKTVAYYHYTVSISESLIFQDIKSKIKDEIFDVIDIKRQMLSSITDRIIKCDHNITELNNLQNILVELNEDTDNNKKQIDILFDKLTQLTVTVENDKSQLQQDIELLYSYINKFILTSITTIKDLHVYMFSSLNTALTCSLPDIYKDPSAPLISGKEDIEMDITVSPRTFYEFPLSIRKGRVVKWTFSTGDNDIGFQVLLRNDINQYLDNSIDKNTIHEETNNENQNEIQVNTTNGDKKSKDSVNRKNDVILVGYQRLGGDGRIVTGTYTGEGKAMLILYFDNQYSIFRYKYIHLRISYRDILISPSHSVLSLKEYSERNSIRSESSSNISINSLKSLDTLSRSITPDIVTPSTTQTINPVVTETQSTIETNEIQSSDDINKTLETLTNLITSNIQLTENEASSILTSETTTTANETPSVSTLETTTENKPMNDNGETIKHDEQTSNSPINEQYVNTIDIEKVIVDESIPQ